jgi:TatD DNase family protein
MLTGYINIHSHHLDDSAQITLLNGQEALPYLPSQLKYSIGYHPWYLGKKEISFEQLQTYAHLPHVLAIGECGLDYHIPIDRVLQLEIFEQQIALANTLQKPLIIHCVKAYQEVLYALKKSKVPAIFHGFNKKTTIAKQIIDAGHYLSFGKDLFNLSHTRDSFSYAPLDQIFFETDNNPALKVYEVYNYAAKIRKSELEIIILHILKNFESIFKL